MKISVTVTSNINVPRHLAKVKDDKFWLYAAAEWRRLYDKFVPMQTGALADTYLTKGTVDITSGNLFGQIEHTVPYAARMYFNNYNFRKDKHPLACSHWDKAAKPTQEPKLIKAMQEHVDSGGLNLGET